ncbi:MAG: hypothetical protein ACE37J_14085 [Pikeienuella sp.]|uniref:hypothetical protein n=1 Tax=Pikeienuella sp. TaxID=2831957 RepID=UPI003919C6B4
MPPATQHFGLLLKLAQPAQPDLRGPPDRCHHYRDETDDVTGWFHIPGCHGGANHPHDCTCEIAGSALERAEEATRIARAEIERLLEKGRRRAAFAQETFDENIRLRRRIRELELANR